MSSPHPLGRRTDTCQEQARVRRMMVQIMGPHLSRQHALWQLHYLICVVDEVPHLRGSVGSSNVNSSTCLTYVQDQAFR